MDGSEALLGGAAEERAAKAQHIDDLVGNPPTEHRLILEGIKDFLNLFENGTYDIGIVHDAACFELIMPPEDHNTGSYHEAYLRGLYPTQPTTNIDPKRVAEWGARIDAGERRQRSGERQPVDPLGAGDMERTSDGGAVDQFETRSGDRGRVDGVAELVDEEAHVGVPNQRHLRAAVAEPAPHE